jgi:radical SAM superfamily enzyme YgiQ (UPF0313 family)
MKILLVYPEFPDTFWSFRHALYFVRRKAAVPPLGLLTVAALLPSAWEKRLVDMNVAPLRCEELAWADYVFLSAMTVQRKSAVEVIQRCKEAGVKVVAGGSLFTTEPEHFPQVDHLVLNEAELTLAPFLADLEAGRLQRRYSTPEYADMTCSPQPQYELLDLRHYDTLSLQFTRGCPFNCDFCNVTTLLGHQVRHKSTTQILAELDRIYALGWRRNVFFVDDNFIGNRKYLKQDLLPALIQWRRGKTGCNFLTQASLNLADDEELTLMMVKAGFISVFIGIETPSEESLSECHKPQNKNRNLVESVHFLQRSGLQVLGGFIVGFDSDPPGIFQRQIDFIQNAGIVTAMVGLLQAPYGTPLFRRLAQEGRLVPDSDFSGNNADGMTNIIPKMDINTLRSGYRRIVEQIYSPRMFYERVRSFLQVYQPVRTHVRLEIQELLAVLRAMYWLGIRDRESLQYWKLILWTLFNAPRKLPHAIKLSVFGFHFRKVSGQV